MRLSDLLPGIAALASTAYAAEDLLFYQGMTYAEYKQALALNYSGMVSLSPFDFSLTAH